MKFKTLAIAAAALIVAIALSHFPDAFAAAGLGDGAFLAVGSLAVAAGHYPGPRGLIGIRADAGLTVPQLIEKLNKTFDEFKAANDERLKQLETSRGEDTLTAQKVDKINAEITNLTSLIKSVEAAANRPNLANGDDPAETRKSVKTMNLALKAHAQRLNRPIPADIDAATYTSYRNAFVTAMRTNNENLSLDVRNALQIGSDPDGGWLCPPELDKEIDRITQSMGAMRGLASEITIGGTEYEKLVTKTGAGFGGWGSERTAPSESTGPGLAKIKIEPGLMWAEPRATSNLLEDASVDIEAWLAGEVGITFSEQEGAAFITGNGVERPRGILSYDTVDNASYTWGNIGYIVSGAASDFAASNPSDKLIDLVHALKRAYRNGATWMMNDLTLAKIRKFKDGNGLYMWAPTGLLGGQVGMLLGYPVATDDFMSDVGAGAFPIAFSNFSRSYKIVNRRGTVVLRDPYTAKPYVKFYTTRRVGGGVQNFEAIKLMKIST